MGFHGQINYLQQNIPGPDWRDGVGVIKSDRLMINPGVELYFIAAKRMCSLLIEPQHKK